MRLPGNRRIAAVVAVSLLLVLAGCSGGGNGTPTATDDGSQGTTTADTSGTPGSNGDSTGMPTYDWSEGESYTYTLGGQSGLTYELAVQSVSGGQVTADVASSMGGRSDSSTITGPQGELLSSNSGNTIAATFLALRAPQAITATHDLRVGNSWSVNSADYNLGQGGQTTPMTGTIEITGTSSVAGHDCYTMTITPDGSDQALNACIAQGWPFALSFEVTNQDRTLEIRLQSATRP